MTIKKPITVHKVKSFRGFPKDKDGTSQTSSVKAVAVPSTRDIYIVRGKTSDSNIQHEIGHVVHRDSDDWPYKPEVFAKDEIRATLYAYKRTGSPRHMLGKLRGIFNDLYRNHYDVSARESLSMIRRALGSMPVPKAWISDYQELKREVIRAFGWSEKK